MQLRYSEVEGEIVVEFHWSKKDACRSPEAIWLHMGFSVQETASYSMTKLGCNIPINDIVGKGSQHIHCVEQIKLGSNILDISVKPIDQPLVCLGGRYLFDVDAPYPTAEDGFDWLVFNNRWGTNFKLWFEEDFQCRYSIKILDSK
jgi:hypothetical protein